MTQVTVEPEAHGPFLRLVLAHETRAGRAQLSVYRVGDTLVDTGGTRVTEALVRALADEPPRRIVCTHQHEDHVGNIGALRRAFGDVPVWAPRAHVGIIASTARVPEYRALFWGHPEPADGLIPYDPGATFDVGPCTLEAVHTPGHTPGHIALVARHGGAVWALSGDLYTNRPLEAWYESACDDMIASWRALARHGDALRLLPTHGRVRDDGAAVLAEGADWLARETDAVEAAALRLATRDPRAVATGHYTSLGPDHIDRISAGEIGRPAFVRSVLSPVRTLPARAP
jgi:glyoxylase-like metal-dependent hydrolase (beta-lactamase superfamily II)